MFQLILELHDFTRLQRLLYIDDPLVITPSESQLDIALGKNERRIDKHIDSLKQRTETRIIDYVLPIITGIAPDILVEVGLDPSSQFSHFFSLEERVATRERDVEIVEIDYLHQLVYGCVPTRFRVPRLRIVTAGTFVRTA